MRFGKHLPIMTALAALSFVGCEDKPKKDGTASSRGALTPTVTGTQAIGKATISALGDSGVSGSLVVTRVPDKNAYQAIINLNGLKAGSVHAVHIHENGDCSNEGQAAGSHFNPTNHPHGKPGDAQSHIGDLGNVTAGTNGTAEATITKEIANEEMERLNLLVGRAIIVHANDDEFTQPTGNAGGRIACGVIETPSESAH
jgi:Cu-Zn family superoxide dismutase